MAGKGSRNIPLVVVVLLSLLALQCTSESVNKPSVDLVEITQDSSILDLEFAKNYRVYTNSLDTILEVTDGKKTWKRVISKTSKDGGLKIPTLKVSCLSTSHLYYFSELDGLNNVKAVSFAESLQDEEVKLALKSGALLNLTNGASDYDAELILELEPDLFTTYPFGDDEFERLQRAGVPTLHFTEYLESHPLGRAEWIKLVGLLLDQEEKADAYFSEVKKQYMLTKLKALTNKTDRPVVINANGYANKWTAPSGNSLVAHFIKDAGGQYVFENDTSAGNLSLDFERVYELANSSDYWASVVFSDSVTLGTFCGEEDRLMDTKVMKSERIFYCNAQRRDYFGKGILQPHLILEDLYQIFYPDSSGYTPHYFERY